MAKFRLNVQTIKKTIKFLFFIGALSFLFLIMFVLFSDSISRVDYSGNLIHSSKSDPFTIDGYTAYEFRGDYYYLDIINISKKDFYELSIEFNNDNVQYKINNLDDDKFQPNQIISLGYHPDVNSIHPDLPMLFEIPEFLKIHSKTGVFEYQILKTKK